MATARQFERDPLLARIASALVWVASFSFAIALFLTTKRIFKSVPPTDPIAVGAVTVEGASKLRDYLVAAYYYAIVPVATYVFAQSGRRLFDRLTRSLRDAHIVALVAFTLPFFFAPLFFLTTRKEGWGVLLPPILGILAVRAVVVHRTTRWLRELLAVEQGPIHALLLTEGIAWILFRYLATGNRIAHIPTLFLEVVFVVFFTALYWIVALYLARLGTLLFGAPTNVALERIAVGASPFLLLPMVALTTLPATSAIVLAVMLTVFAISQLQFRIPVGTVRRILSWLAIPALLFVTSFAASTPLSDWIDLFHRGESLGPASDYLRGKVPYRDVFVLHGLLEDGLLDAWLMEIFGRRADIAGTRAAIVSSLTIPALWCLGLVIFDSLPLAAIIAAVSFMTFLENQRALLEIVVVTLLIAALRRARLTPILIAGAVAALALFFSFEIGLYSVIAGAAALVILGHTRGALTFLAGFVGGATPFLIYLGVRGALGAFFETSFVTLPRIIDATWSLPFPDLESWLRHDLTLPAISGFVLSERIAYILNPVVIGVALACLVARFWRKGIAALRQSPIDQALVVVTLFALVTQRSALGRADFRHQYFSAFLFVPILVMLLSIAVRRSAMLWKTEGAATRSFLVVVALVFIPIFFVSLWVPDLVNARLDAMTRYRLRGAVEDPAGTVVRNRIGAVGAEIARLTRENDPIFDFSNQPAFYFFASRPNPTRFYQIPIASPLFLQADAIRDLQDAKPALVLRRSPEGYDRFDGIENDLRAPAVAAYLDEHYRFHRKIHGIELWRRVEGRPYDLQRYVREHRIPSFASRLAREWSIFPSVGSLAGVAGSYWRSDLTLHNPHNETIDLRLRYVSNLGAFEERVSLAPSSVARYQDVAESLFKATGSRGVLRIEHPSDRKPIMSVRTYDSSKGNRGTIERPLSLREAATAGSERDELTIAGVRGIDDYRLNLGVINVGDIPLRVRITNTTGEGHIVGEPIDALIEEDVSHLFVNAPAELGAPIDESITTHIRVLEGTAIAYASVIDTTTGNHQVVQAIPTKAVNR